MAKTGRKPLPTKIKNLRGGKGTYHRKPNENEPQPEISDKPPKAPAYLSKPGQAEWRRLAKELHAIGLLTKVDIVALAAYCECFSQWVDITGKLQKFGMWTKSDKGHIIQSPFWSMKNKVEGEMRKWMSEFGMTPSSRANVKATEKKKDSPLETFLKGGGKPYPVK